MKFYKDTTLLKNPEIFLKNRTILNLCHRKYLPFLTKWSDKNLFSRLINYSFHRDFLSYAGFVNNLSYICELKILKYRMYSSRKNNTNIVLSIYRDKRTVFRLNDIAMLIGETNFQSLNKKLNYYVSTGKLLNPRKGIYAKPDFDFAELACTIYKPSYISLEYVLIKSGIIFQYDSRITSVSYLSRSIEITGTTYLYRKIKGEILLNTAGIIRQDNHINIASAERAFLDLLYLNTEYYFDNLKLINKQLVIRLLNIYQSATLSKRVSELLIND
jgi:hypothetical protein